MSSKKFWIQLEEENAVVTDYYLHVIGESISADGNEVVYSRGWDSKNAKNADVIIVSTATAAMKAILLSKTYILWTQGLWPEESYMRNKSNIRYRICNLIERIAIKRAQNLFMVSGAMVEYYQRKYNLYLREKTFIMPCSNEKLHEEAFFTDNKYNENVFCFAGSTSIWQCFEETIRLYSLIEKECNKVKLMLLVKDRELAEKLVKKYEIKNYEIDFVGVDELKNKLSKVKFGFLLREDTPVNRVASPTKLLTYLANGIIPIYSNCLDGVEEVLQDTTYKIPYDNTEIISEVIEWIDKAIEPKQMLMEYKKVYYSNYDEREKRHAIIEFLK